MLDFCDSLVFLVQTFFLTWYFKLELSLNIFIQLEHFQVSWVTWVNSCLFLLDNLKKDFSQIWQQWRFSFLWTSKTCLKNKDVEILQSHWILSSSFINFKCSLKIWTWSKLLQGCRKVINFRVGRICPTALVGITLTGLPKIGGASGSGIHFLNISLIEMLQKCYQNVQKWTKICCFFSNSN